MTLRHVLLVALLLGLPLGCQTSTGPRAGDADHLEPTLRLPVVFSDHMVLQQNIRLPMWGWGKPGENVSIFFGGQAYSTIVEPDGTWRVEIGPFTASNVPGQLNVVAESGAEVLTDVLVGEVWVCSGQSNMAWRVAAAKDAEQEIADAANYPEIRLLQVARAADPVEPHADLDQGTAWQVASPETVANFSAVGYFFGRNLHKQRNVPVGLIDSSFSGTPAEAWTSREALEKLDFMTDPLAEADRERAEYDPQAARAEYEQQMAEWKPLAEQARKEGNRPPRKPRLRDPFRHPRQPASLYNAMIAPIVPYAIRGVIWYQGESNAGRPEQYRTLLPAMIRDWRDQWGQGRFPFLLVQLANFLPKQTQPVQHDATWPWLREAQAMATAVPNTAMVSAIDLGETDDIHPRNKQGVAERLALAARALAYGEGTMWSGPTYKSHEIQGDKVVITFENVGEGMVSAEGTPNVEGFAIAGEDRQFHWADARIQGDTVIVSSEQVPNPVAVRYGWANNPLGNLYNRHGLPANPFRTDGWYRLTEEPQEEKPEQKPETTETQPADQSSQ